MQKKFCFCNFFLFMFLLHVPRNCLEFNFAQSVHTIDWEIFVVKKLCRSPSTTKIKQTKHFLGRISGISFSLSGHSVENKTSQKFNRQNILPAKKFPIYGMHKVYRTCLKFRAVLNGAFWCEVMCGPHSPIYTSNKKFLKKQGN